MLDRYYEATIGYLLVKVAELYTYKQFVRTAVLVCTYLVLSCASNRMKYSL